jgi:cytoskeletal protein CcmA (bactofilin family)
MQPECSDPTKGSIQMPNANDPNASTASSPNQTQYTMIGKSIRIKGEIAASDPIYIYGSVEGTIEASAHRVTVGKEGTVKADITAREVVIMGDVCGKVHSDERVEIRSEGSLLGNLSTKRLCVEEGAVLQGSIDVHMQVEKAKPAAAGKPVQAETAPAAEQEQNLALSEAS